jgi:hypothetical protein
MAPIFYSQYLGMSESDGRSAMEAIINTECLRIASPRYDRLCIDVEITIVGIEKFPWI